MKIKLLTSIAHGEHPLLPGAVIETSDEIGQAWVADGMAAVDDSPGPALVWTPHAVAAKDPVPEADPAALRTDGPTLEVYVQAGYTAAGYPPPGYAPVPSEGLTVYLETGVAPVKVPPPPATDDKKDAPIADQGDGKKPEPSDDGA